MRNVLREVVFSRHLMSESRLQYKEAKAFEHDLQKVNQQLAIELNSVKASFESLQKSKKLVDMELKSERNTLQVGFIPQV